MTDDEFYVPLNIPDPRAELRNEDVDRALTLVGTHPYFNGKHFHIPSSLVEIIEKIGLKINPERSFMFRLIPNGTGGIHLDGNLKSIRPHGINFSWNAARTEMHWFEKKQPDDYIFHNSVLLPYFNPDRSKLVFSKILTGCNLVNLTYPHRVKNLTNENRLSLSIGIAEDLSWDEFKKVLQDNGLVKS